MLQIKTFTFGPFETNCYVVSFSNSSLSEAAHSIIIIDPACSNEYEQQELLAYISKLTANSQEPIAIIATHGHLDHLWGAKWACEQWHTSVLMHPDDIPLAQAMQQQYDLFGIRRKPEPFPIEQIPSSFHLSPFNFQFSPFTFLHSPGHTPGSVCLYFPEDKVLFSGDTLFRMGYGRTDLPGGNIDQLFTSLQRLFALPPDTRVFPGHGDATTIRAERRY